MNSHFRNNLLGEPERQMNVSGVWMLISFAILFVLFVWRITAHQMGFPVSVSTLGTVIRLDWAIVALATITMFLCWRYNRRPYKLELNDIFKDNAAWAIFWMSFFEGVAGLGGIFRLY